MDGYVKLRVLKVGRGTELVDFTGKLRNVPLSFKKIFIISVSKKIFFPSSAATAFNFKWIYKGFPRIDRVSNEIRGLSRSKVIEYIVIGGMILLAISRHRYI